MSRRPLVAAIVALVLGAAAAAPATARTHHAVAAHRLIVVVRKNLPAAAERKLAVLILVSQSGGAPGGAVATPGRALTIRLTNSRLYRVKAEIDSACTGSCAASYRISGSADHRLEVVPNCRRSGAGFACSKLTIVKLS